MPLLKPGMMFSCLSPTRSARGCKADVTWNKAWAPLRTFCMHIFQNHIAIKKRGWPAIKFQVVSGMWCGWLERFVITSYVVVPERLYWEARVSRSFQIPRVSTGCLIVIDYVFHKFLFLRYLSEWYRRGSKKFANPQSILLYESLRHKLKPDILS